MSEENPTPTPTPTDPQQAQQQQMQLVIDDRELRTVYVNGYMFQPSGEEVVLDIGFNLPRPNPQGGQPQVWFKITDRLVMTYPTAKKLAMSLTQFVKRYEQQFGEIPTQPGQRR